MIGILLSYIIASFGWISTSALWKFQIKTSPSVRINPLFATTSTISEQTSNPKSTLLRQIDGVESDIFVCPESLAPLKLVRRQFGLVDSSYLRDDKFKREYPLSRQGM